MQDTNIDIPKADSPPSATPASGWTRFALGLLIGGAAVGLFTTYNVRSATPALDAAAIQSIAREAAREGAATAIAQAVGGQPPVAVNPAGAPAGAASAGLVAGPVVPQVPPDPADGPLYTVEYRPANTMGNTNAPVTMIEYGDFECGYCRRFNDTTMRQVIDSYVKTGKLKLSYKHYPFLADSSLPKAHLAECAAEQGKFWEMHDALFSDKLPRADEPSMMAQGITLAATMGIDASKFKDCVNDDSVRQRVITDSKEAQRVGVTGTPTFLINGKPLVGAQPFAAFKLAIEGAPRTGGAPR